MKALKTYGVPLELGDFWNLQKEPLSCNVFETRLLNPKFHSAFGKRSVEQKGGRLSLLTARMHKHLGEICRATSTYLSIYSFAKVNDTGPDDESPAEISKAMFRGVERESADVVGID